MAEKNDFYNRLREGGGGINTPLLDIEACVLFCYFSCLYNAKIYTPSFFVCARWLCGCADR